MSKRVLKVRNALTGKVREVVLPGAPAPKKKPVARDISVELKPEVGAFVERVAEVRGDGDGAGLG